MSQEKNQDKNQRKGGPVIVILTICAVFIVILLGIMIFLLLKKDNTENNSNIAFENTSVNRNVVVNEENVKDIAKEIENKEKIAPGYYEVSMSSTWTFENSSAISKDAYVKNAITNDNSVYFDITLADSEETIYESPILPVDTYLDNIALDSSLDSGSYDCVITYNLLDESNKVISTVRVTLVIIIEQ